MKPEEDFSARVHVYTGSGKGKTTAALGLALRACGHGKKVAVFQFLKGTTYTGEFRIQKKIPGLELHLLGKKAFVNLEHPSDEDRQMARQGWTIARQALQEGGYDLVILDELNVVLSSGLLDTEKVLDALSGRPAGTEVVITGRNAPVELVKQADLVTEMIAIKHYYQEGIPGREGIEW